MSTRLVAFVAIILTGCFGTPALTEMSTNQHLGGNPYIDAGDPTQPDLTPIPPDADMTPAENPDLTDNTCAGVEKITSYVWTCDAGGPPFTCNFIAGSSNGNFCGVTCKGAFSFHLDWAQWSGDMKFTANGFTCTRG